MDKTILRGEMLEDMRRQTEKDVSEKSEKIMHRIVSLDCFESASHIFLYLSNPGEVSTGKIIEHASASGKKVYAPIVDGDRIVAGLLDGQLRKGRFGLMEPMNSTERKTFDMIIVPGVVFDKSCARIGRGGGYFDRFLSTARGQKVGLAFDFQIVDKIPTERHDVFLDFVVTEKRVLKRL